MKKTAFCLFACAVMAGSPPCLAAPSGDDGRVWVKAVERGVAAAGQ